MLLFLGDFVYAGVASTDALSTSPFRYETLLQLSSAADELSSPSLQRQFRLQKIRFEFVDSEATSAQGAEVADPGGVEQGATVLMMKNSTKFPLTVNFPLLELRILNDTATHKL